MCLRNVSRWVVGRVCLWAPVILHDVRHEVSVSCSVLNNNNETIAWFPFQSRKHEVLTGLRFRIGLKINLSAFQPICSIKFHTLKPRDKIVLRHIQIVLRQFEEYHH